MRDQYESLLTLLQNRIMDLEALLTGRPGFDPNAYRCLRRHEQEAILKELLELKTVLLSVCNGVPLYMYQAALSQAIDPPPYKEAPRKSEVIVCALKAVEKEFLTFLTYDQVPAITHVEVPVLQPSLRFKVNEIGLPPPKRLRLTRFDKAIVAITLLLVLCGIGWLEARDRARKERFNANASTTATTSKR